MGADDKTKSITTRAGEAVKLAGPVFLWLAGLFSEKNFLYFAAIAIIALIVVAVVSPWWPTRASTILDGDGVPIQTPLSPKWVRPASAVAAVVLIVLTLLAWGPARETLFPMAVIDRYGPSMLRFDGGERYINHYPHLAIREDGKEYKAYRSMRLEVTKQSKTIRISEVRLATVPVRVKQVIIQYGAGSANVIMPNRYKVKLSPTTPKATAQMYDGETPSPGVAVLDDEHPTAVLLIEFDGDVPCLYDVWVELDLTDDTGRKRTIRTDYPVLAHVLVEDKPQGK